MPVKKTKKDAAKKPAKKPIRTSVKKISEADQQVKADIKKAVEKIPGLIVEHLDFNPLRNLNLNEPEENNANNFQPNFTAHSEPAIRANYTSKDYQTKKFLMIFAVAFLSLFIFGMWAWNALIAVQDLNYSKSKQPGIWDNAKQSFKAIMNDDQTDLTKKFDTLQAEKTKADNEAALKQGLASVVSTLINSSSLNSVTSTKK